MADNQQTNQNDVLLSILEVSKSLAARKDVSPDEVIQFVSKMKREMMGGDAAPASTAQPQAPAAEPQKQAAPKSEEAPQKTEEKPAAKAAPKTAAKAAPKAKAATAKPAAKTEEPKKKRRPGRPKMTEEEKAAARAKREAEKAARMAEERDIKPVSETGQQPAVAIENAVTADEVFCLECGKGFAMLRRHLSGTHDLTPEEYRAKWELPSDFPIVAPNYSKQKRAAAARSGLGHHERAN